MSRRESTWLRAVRAAGPKGSLPLRKPDWLARALARAGVLPPDEAAHAITTGRVTSGGVVIRDPLALFRPEDEVLLDGRMLNLDAPTLVLVFHKPAGCVVAKHDVTGAPTVLDRLRAALPPELARFGWHAVGRLDRDTTGLLLFSNDERLVAHGTSPATHLPKRYRARVRGAITDAALERLRCGLTLTDGPTRPALAQMRGEDDVELTLTEGRKHQVKRMLAAVGLRVTALHREAVGSVVLDVPEGTFRALHEHEVSEGLCFRPLVRAVSPIAATQRASSRPSPQRG